MQSLLVPVDQIRDDARFTSLPAETITAVFCMLPSFADVFALTETCARFRRIWTTNLTAIYIKVAKRSIPCERHARVLLADQGGPPLNAPLSAEDMLRMVHNARVVQKAILQFEKEIVDRVQSAGLSSKKYYGIVVRKRLLNLTRTERPRFIRSYYRLWGMMEVGSAEWQPRLEAMTLKQLYHLCEMTNLTQRIEGEDVVLEPQLPDADPDSYHAINLDQSKKRIALGEQIWDHIERFYQRVYHMDAEWPWIYTKDERFLWLIAMWDHWQGELRKVVCRPYTEPACEKGYLWDDSSDEEA